MNKKTNKYLFLFSCICLLLFTKCFMLNRFIYSDKELAQHYQNKKVKPTYHKINFLNRHVHYAKVSLNDTLPLLVFIHGAPGFWYGYMNLMDDSLLQTKYKMISVDRLGYGKSGYGKAELSTQMQALSILEIVEQENKSNKKVALLGRSYGAPIAAWLAINYPQNIDKLFMVSPVIDPQHEKFYWFSGIGKWKLTQLFLPDVLNVATKEKYAHITEMKKMQNKWKNLYVPSYVLTGENDNIADTANFSFAKKFLTNNNVYFNKLKNTGHLITYERAGYVKELLMKAN